MSRARACGGCAAFGMSPATPPRGVRPHRGNVNHMSEHRPICGADVHAILRRLGPGAYEAELAEAWIDDDAGFTSLEELEAHCPPERLGLSPGAFAALLGPLFGEFE